MNYLINKYVKEVLTVAGTINLIVVFILKPSCPWKVHFNIDCAGCGATRMIQSLIKLDFYQSFRFNPFLFCLLMIVIIYGIYVLICKGIHKTYYKIKQRDWWLLLILVVLFMILRNIPLFYYLKPTIVR